MLSPSANAEAFAGFALAACRNASMPTRNALASSVHFFAASRRALSAFASESSRETRSRLFSTSNSSLRRRRFVADARRTALHNTRCSSAASICSLKASRSSVRKSSSTRLDARSAPASFRSPATISSMAVRATSCTSICSRRADPPSRGCTRTVVSASSSSKSLPLSCSLPNSRNSASGCHGASPSSTSLPCSDNRSLLKSSSRDPGESNPRRRFLGGTSLLSSSMPASSFRLDSSSEVNGDENDEKEDTSRSAFSSCRRLATGEGERSGDFPLSMLARGTVKLSVRFVVSRTECGRRLDLRESIITNPRSVNARSHNQSTDTRAVLRKRQSTLRFRLWSPGMRKWYSNLPHGNAGLWQSPCTLR
eukprot:Opistho-1_new@79666